MAEELGQRTGAQIIQQMEGGIDQTIHALRAGRSVILDGSNLGYRKRIRQLRQLRALDLAQRYICILVTTPYSICIEKACRAGLASVDQMEQQFRGLWLPFFYEGWDDVVTAIPNNVQQGDIAALFQQLNAERQAFGDDELTVGHHCLVAYGLAGGQMPVVQEAALLHDIGKPLAKTVRCNEARHCLELSYHKHENISAYESLFYSSKEIDSLYAAVLIQWHSQPARIATAKDPARAQQEFLALVGEQVYNDVLELHEINLLAQRLPESSAG